MIFLMISSIGCSSGSQKAVNSENAATTNGTNKTPTPENPAKMATENIRASLANARKYGENVYEYAKTSDWHSANFKLGDLRQTAKAVRSNLEKRSDAADSLDEHVAALGLAVAVKDRLTAMREANRVTLDVANMTETYKLNVPVGVMRLDYYGRELEIWTEAKDEDRLKATAREMRREWDAVRPTVEAHSVAEAKEFGALVTQVESARTPSDYASDATLVLNEEDKLEELFHGD